MARTPEFEDMYTGDWPHAGDLSYLHEAAEHAYIVYSELATMPPNLAPSLYWQAEYTELAGQAWALLKAIRKAGILRLGEQEAAQHV